MILHSNQKFSMQPLTFFEIIKSRKGKSTYRVNKVSYRTLSLEFIYFIHSTFAIYYSTYKYTTYLKYMGAVANWAK